MQRRDSKFLRPCSLVCVRVNQVRNFSTNQNIVHLIIAVAANNTWACMVKSRRKTPIIVYRAELTCCDIVQWLGHSCKDMNRAYSPALRSPSVQAGSGCSWCPQPQLCSGTDRSWDGTRAPPLRDGQVRSPVGHTSSLTEKNTDTGDGLVHIYTSRWRYNIWCTFWKGLSINHIYSLACT